MQVADRKLQQARLKDASRLISQTFSQVSASSKVLVYILKHDNIIGIVVVWMKVEVDATLVYISSQYSGVL